MMVSRYSIPLAGVEHRSGNTRHREVRDIKIRLVEVLQMAGKTLSIASTQSDYDRIHALMKKAVDRASKIHETL